MDRRRVLSFLGFTTAATVVGAGSLSAAPGMPKPPKEPENREPNPPAGPEALPPVVET